MPHDRRPRPGRFISFEGGEGSGKSTQARKLHAWLAERGVPALLTREPGGEAGAEAIRALLVEGDPERWEPVAEVLLFLAARHQHFVRVIVPALASGTHVISDRFHDSSRVYQGLGKGLGIGYYDLLHAAVLGNAVPDRTFYLDIAPETGLGRALRRSGSSDEPGAHHATETRFEEMDIAFHLKVRNGFLQLAQGEPGRIRVIDAAAGDAETVFQGILREGDFAEFMKNSGE